MTYAHPLINVESLKRRFKPVFEEDQAAVLAEAITDAYADLVKTDDFNELKAIVKDLAETQQRTEVKIEQLAGAQQRTEVKIEKLTGRIDDLTVNIDKLARTVGGLAQEVGGLSRTMGYSLENEAYRLLPAYLKTHHQIALTERIIRTDIGGEEINFFARGEQDGKSICLVGEMKSRLDERRAGGRAFDLVYAQLQAKIEAVQKEYPDCDIIPMLVTHYARPGMLKQAKDEGLIIVQSFEW